MSDKRTSQAGQDCCSVTIQKILKVLSTCLKYQYITLVAEFSLKTPSNGKIPSDSSVLHAPPLKSEVRHDDDAAMDFPLALITHQSMRNRLQTQHCLSI